jgi:hypothetical protein
MKYTFGNLIFFLSILFYPGICVSQEDHDPFSIGGSFSINQRSSMRNYSICISAGIRPFNFLEFEGAAGIFLFSGNFPTQLRVVIHPTMQFPIFGGIGYYYLDPLDHDPMGEYDGVQNYTVNGHELFLGFGINERTDLEAGWRVSDEPWRIRYSEGRAEEPMYLREWFISLKLRIVSF